MYARITKAFVAAQVCPARGQIIIRDTDLKGFALRLTANCKSFVVEGRVIGTQRRVTIGRLNEMTLEQARATAQKILADWKAGIDVTKLPAPPTLQVVMDAFLAERQMKLETKRSYRRLIERSMPDWLSLPVTDITREMVLQRHQELIRPTRCGTNNKACANSAMQVLRCLINFAGSKYPGISLSNPTDALKWRRYRTEPRQGTIPDAQLSKFFRAVIAEPKIARDFILLLLFTGLRRNEAAKLKWSNIDFESSTLTVEAEHNKSNRVHTLPLTPIITAILQSRLPAESEYVFPGRYGGHLNEPRAVLARLRRHGACPESS